MVYNQAANGWPPHMNTHPLYEDEKTRDTGRALIRAIYGDHFTDESCDHVLDSYQQLFLALELDHFEATHGALYAPHETRVHNKLKGELEALNRIIDAYDLIHPESEHQTPSPIDPLVRWGYVSAEDYERLIGDGAETAEHPLQHFEPTSETVAVPGIRKVLRA